ncbi:MAG: pitrilysin family protein [SAR202 cluster bacterium]|jgi:zinc protease|nr:pitrilysin family protein [SAR202 cluster bacterium]
MISIPLEKRSLSNGLDVITHVDNSVPVVAVNVWYHVGSKNEVPGRTGFAHLFEHVMFEGSKNHNKDYFEPLQKIGANINGSTTNDRTNYWEDLPSNYLELALWLESDRMGFLLDALDQERFDLQRDVVKNERRQSYENRPYGMAHLRLQEALFPKPHPYNWPTIGSQEDLDAASLEDVMDFFKKYYSPSNASIAIAGDIDPDRVYDQVTKYFGGLEPAPSLERSGRMDSLLSGQTSIELEDAVQLPRIYLAWPTLPDFTDTQAALDVLSVILSDGRSSRLNRKLVYEDQKVHDVRAYHHGQEISGEFHITATASPGETLESIEEELLLSLDQISSSPPSESEMIRAKNRITSYHILQMEKIGGFGGRADQLNFYNVMTGDPSAINTDIDRYQSITADEISNAAGTLDGKHVRLTVSPKRDRKAISTGINRKNAPVHSGEILFTPPTPEQSVLDDGTEIILINKPSLPITTVGMLLKTGGIDDPKHLAGLAKFSTDMLIEGTTTRSSSQIADEIEFIGSHLSKETSREHTILAVSGLSNHLAKGLDLLSDVVQNPSFPSSEYERLKNEKLADLSTLGDNADLVANISSRSILYGATSPYGHPVNGTTESVASIVNEEINKHYDDHISPCHRTFLVVGNTLMEDAVKLIEQNFTSEKPLPSGSIVENTREQFPPLAGTTIHIIDRPRSAQSVIRAGHRTVPRSHEDYYALAFLNYVLGGDYSSRLNMNLRQDKGYSYGFYSSLMWLKASSVWLARGSVQTEVTKESVIEVLSELTDIKGNKPITPQEFDQAKEGLLKGIPAQFETNSQIMEQLIRMTAFELPLDHFTTSMHKLQSLKLDDVTSAAKRHLFENHISVIIVGDRLKIEPKLRELDIPIVISDIYGNIAP